MGAAKATRAGAPALAAYVLHSHDWSESSLIVELFTRSQGRLAVVAKGAKRPTSNFRPVLLPFQPLAVQLSKASADEQAEVRGLRSAEWVGQAPLPNSALMSGFYANELLLKGLARQDPHPGLFDAYADTLRALAAGHDEAAALRAFELLWLQELGLLPELGVVTATTQALVPTARYGLRADHGVVQDREGASGATWLALQAALAAGDAAALRRACAVEAAALRAPLRHLVHYHLGTTQLRSRQVGQRLRQWTADAAAAAAAQSPAHAQVSAPASAPASASTVASIAASADVSVDAVAVAAT
jgi:DNA repair protein RecO (recombination protein O)